MEANRLLALVALRMSGLVTAYQPLTSWMETEKQPQLGISHSNVFRARSLMRMTDGDVRWHRGTFAPQSVWLRDNRLPELIILKRSQETRFVHRI